LINTAFPKVIAIRSCLSKKDAYDQKLRIYTLGRFVVCRNNEQLSEEHSRSRKLWDLFMYIITQRDKPLAAEIISESLWPEQECENPGSIVKNLIHRLRQKIDLDNTSPKTSLVVNHHGCYKFNPETDYWLDAEEFEALCNEARSYLKSNPAKACTLYQKALDLYKGEYLPESPYSDWLMPTRHYYRQLYIASVAKLLALLKDQHNYTQMLIECEKAFSIEHLEEIFHVRYLEALIGQDEVSRARAHYEYISSLYYKEFGTKPSPALIKLYQAIIKNSEKREDNFSDIADLLQERDQSDGALICEPEVFCVLCRMERRRAEREDRPIHIGVLSLVRSDYRQPDPDHLSNAMDILKDLLLINLRKGDVFACWNNNEPPPVCWTLR
jgi:DNA-binding SARP family transcriptional activator